VPDWAVGRSYTIRIINRTPLHLSCEITVDDATVIARNAPIPAETTRSIRPDRHRYFEAQQQHSWVLQPAERTKLLPQQKMNAASAAVADDDDDDDDETNNETDDVMETTTTTEPSANDNSKTIFYAKDDSYNFDTAGHENRRTALHHLQQQPDFQQWEQAARATVALLHAKFYVAVPVWRHGPTSHNHHHPNTKQRRPPEPLPQPVPIVDVKATERAVWSTSFRAMADGGGAINLAQQGGSSRIRMERIAGLVDDDPALWATGPVLERQLYYRAAAVTPGDNDDDNDSLQPSDDEEDKDGNAAMEEEDEATITTTIPSLSDYKNDRWLQVQQWHLDHHKAPPDAAAAALDSCCQTLQSATSHEAVDQSVQEYWAWRNQNEWATTTTNGTNATV